ncbi:MAG: hypothetical protein CV082_03070 [Candidatus Brocadia sp. BL1]|nr:MAG: hypothetical protein CV082_03070 [Candidatus Brocadia sp. BL1]
MSTGRRLTCLINKKKRFSVVMLYGAEKRVVFCERRFCLTMKHRVVCRVSKKGFLIFKRKEHF